jgi:hypothetical protein
MSFRRSSAASPLRQPYGLRQRARQSIVNGQHFGGGTRSSILDS